MEYGLLSAAHKAAVEAQVANFCRKLAGLKLPVMAYLSDRYWIMSFATDTPIIPVDASRILLHRQLAANLAPASMVPLFATDSQKLLDNGIMGLDPLEAMSLTAVNETSDDEDKLYTRACKAEAYFLDHDIYDGERAHKTHMWAVGKCRLRLEYLKEAFLSVPRAVRQRFPGVLDKHARLPELFDEWLKSAEKCEAHWNTLTPKDADYLDLKKAVDAFKEAIGNAATLLTFASHDHKSICEIGGWDDTPPASKISLREDVRGELYRAYPQVFRYDDATKTCKRSNVHHPDNLRILANPAGGYTVHADLRIGMQGYNEAFTLADPRNAELYPTIAYMAIAEPKHHAFFINMKRKLDPEDVTFSVDKAGSKEIPTPYYDEEHKRLLTRSEAIQLPRLSVKKATGMEVSPINPSVPSRLEINVVDPSGTIVCPKGSLVGGTVVAKSCTVHVFNHTRLLLPGDYDEYKQNGRTGDPVFDSIPDTHEFLLGFDFIVSTPGMADGVSTYGTQDIGALAVSELSTAVSTSQITQWEVNLRVATKDGRTRYTIYALKLKGVTP